MNVLMTMNQETSDQGWQQLQAHIEGFFGQALRNDVQRIEYKPRFIAALSEMSSEYPQMEGALSHSRTSASGIVGKKGGPSNAPHKRSMDV